MIDTGQKFLSAPSALMTGPWVSYPVLPQVFLNVHLDQVIHFWQMH